VNDSVDLAQKAGSEEGVQKDVAKVYDQAHGTYADAAADMTNVEQKLATAQMPKAPDPSPFSLGPMTPGGR